LTNFIIEALQYNRPVILTEANGISERLGDAVLYVDPLNVLEISNAISTMCDENNREKYSEKAKQFSFERTYDDIARELVTLFEKV